MRLRGYRSPFAPPALAAAIALASFAAASFAQTSATLPPGPEFADVLGLRHAGSPQISPDGTQVAYTVRSTDWKNNRYDTEIWLAGAGAAPRQLTRTRDGSSDGHRWSPDGRTIAFFADRGGGNQIWLIPPDGGEARPLTGVTEEISSFEWSPDGAGMALLIADARAPDLEKRETALGAFAIEDTDYRMRHLWVLDVGAALELEEAPGLSESDDGEGDDDSANDGDEATPKSPFRRLTHGDDFTVGDLRWSPDGSRIAFTHTPDPRVESFSHSDISIVDVASSETIALVTLPGPDGQPRWSPDGQWVAFTTANGETAYYRNTELAKVPAEGGDPVVLTADFDEDVSLLDWLADGLRFLALERTQRRLYRLSPDGGRPEILLREPERVSAVSYAADGRALALSGDSADSMTEIYHRLADGAELARLSAMTEQTNDWPNAGSEVISWKSRDGAEIEGVLLTPPDFDPARKHPLLVVIHGGPSSISYPMKVHTYVYPIQQWLAKGAVVLMPNYRGSAGYGEAFRELNVRNLGVGDAWDVLSGVEHLVGRGFVDAHRVGAMGWSQGGYISAFLTTTSDRFAAISVGAGISNWMTYYVNTDIHPFTRHYLEATPWDDPEIYATTSPMTYIKQAKTPTLIQHGELDQRVPTPNAYELYQGLRDVGATTRLIIYKGFGHGISKPKELLAAVWHNWQWFARYLWDEEVEIPLE